MVGVVVRRRMGLHQPRLGPQPPQRRRRPRRGGHAQARRLPRPARQPQPHPQQGQGRLPLAPGAELVGPGRGELRPPQTVGVFGRERLRHRPVGKHQPPPPGLIDRPPPPEPRLIPARQAQHARRPLHHHLAHVVQRRPDQRQPPPGAQGLGPVGQPAGPRQSLPRPAPAQKQPGRPVPLRRPLRRPQHQRRRLSLPDRGGWSRRSRDRVGGPRRPILHPPRPLPKKRPLHRQLRPARLRHAREVRPPPRLRDRPVERGQRPRRIPHHDLHPGQGCARLLPIATRWGGGPRSGGGVEEGRIATRRREVACDRRGDGPVRPPRPRQPARPLQPPHLGLAADRRRGDPVPRAQHRVRHPLRPQHEQGPPLALGQTTARVLPVVRPLGVRRRPPARMIGRQVTQPHPQPPGVVRPGVLRHPRLPPQRPRVLPRVPAPEQRPPRPVIKLAVEVRPHAPCIGRSGTDVGKSPPAPRKPRRPQESGGVKEYFGWRIGGVGGGRHRGAFRPLLTLSGHQQGPLFDAARCRKPVSGAQIC